MASDQLENEINSRAMARYALFFAAESETFPVFKQWAARNAATSIGADWAANLTIEELRAAALEVHELDGAMFPWEG